MIYQDGNNLYIVYNIQDTDWLSWCN